MEQLCNRKSSELVVNDSEKEIKVPNSDVGIAMVPQGGGNRTIQDFQYSKPKTQSVT